jgi:SAM-dependent methyltransferase
MLKVLRTRVLSEEAMASASDADLEENLRDLRFINRWTGARRKLRSILREHFDSQDSFSFLDIGAASGDIARNVRSAFPHTRTLVLDLDPRNLRLAPPPKLAGDAFRLPLRDGACDVVHCSLFLHHFTNNDCARILAEMYRVASKLVIVQDLHRHPIAYRFLPWTKALFSWHPITVDDGMLSVAAAWRKDELFEILRATRLDKQSRVQWHFPSFRYFIAISKSEIH